MSLSHAFAGVYQGRNGRWQAQVDHKVSYPYLLTATMLIPRSLSARRVLTNRQRACTQSIGGYSTAWEAGVAVAARLALRDYGIHAAVATAVQGPKDEAST